ncbi:tRNA adenosine(34) deaminase TadA [Blochmannia endosymbiont of Colobopsis nipponica]|uniref:tRNA adenosine(34) deaminase TadA n=1 Tax=Blochmannia endosymbiont of Colobopsis nipponica TaxID=2681987 RepID=UPI00177E2C32|nr:tRNA adenosine(34) deaminase TadA [Blochmannia endosymbiont of Colobopsis nipponica]QOI10934.1 tRNA adenosine(34) deaminase TadA [Blochmannia endosymbiont of Colobopsis nipponica]
MKIDDDFWMFYALSLAKFAGSIGEVAIGAVLVLNNKVVGEGYNNPIGAQDPTAHAEIVALRRGSNVLKNYRLLRTTLYVTLEPCIMCVGAIINARISRLVFGAKNNKKFSAVDSLLSDPKVKHRVVITSGVLSNLCSKEIINFFKNRRRTQNVYSGEFL